MNILFICTSNKDRSPALAEHFKNNYPKHEYRSAGINRYFTSKKNTHYLTNDDISWADLIICAEDIHRTVANNRFNEFASKNCMVLNIGDYKQGEVGQEYLSKAENKLKQYL